MPEGGGQATLDAEAVGDLVPGSVACAALARGRTYEGDLRVGVTDLVALVEDNIMPLVLQDARLRGIDTTARKGDTNYMPCFTRKDASKAEPAAGLFHQQ